MKFKGTCGLCGRAWAVEGQPVGPGPYYSIPCPLDGKPVTMVQDSTSSAMLSPFNFNDLINNPANSQLIVDLTETKWPDWFKNFSENAETIRTGLNLADIPKRKGPALIVGAGPSLYRYEHMKIIAKNRDKIGTLIATDKMLKPLMEHGAKPDFVTSVDGDPVISQFFNLDAPAEVDVILDAVTCHPKTLKEVQKNTTGKIWWFVHFVDNPLETRCPHCRRLSTTAGFHFLSGNKVIMQASGNCGALAWHLAQHLNCNPIILTGMDYGYPADLPIEKTIYWSSFVSMCAGNESLAKRCYETRTNPYFKNQHNIDLIWNLYHNVLMGFIKAAAPTLTTINATGGGSLYEDPIVSMDLEEALEKHCAQV